MSKLFDYIVQNNTKAAIELIPSLSESELEQRYQIGEFLSCTSLHIAALLGQDEVVKSLLDHGANAQARDKFNQTPMHYAATACEEADSQSKLNVLKHLHYVESYLIYDIDNKGDTPLHVAASSGEYEWTKFLLEMGSSATTKNINQFKPIDLAPDDEKLLRLLRMQESSLQVTALRKIKAVVKTPQDQTTSEELWSQFLNTAPEHLISQYLVLDETSPRLAVWCFNRAREAELAPQDDLAQTQTATTALGESDLTAKLAGLSLK
jgi:ankyrin repeat protein